MVSSSHDKGRQLQSVVGLKIIGSQSLRQEKNEFTLELASSQSALATNKRTYTNK